MLKLLKYEFRKALVSFLTLLGVTVAAEIYFLISLKTDQEGHLGFSMLLLLFLTFSAAIFVFVRGVVSYSGELRNRSGYLLFLTPRSTLQILASKYLYTFVNGLLLSAVFGALAFLDVGLFNVHYNEYASMYDLAKNLLSSYGVYLDSILASILFAALYGFFELLSMVGLSYFAITLSHTLLRDKKWRWLVAVALYIALSWAVSYICSLFPSLLKDAVMIDPFGLHGAPTVDTIGVSSIVRYLLPTLCVNAAVVIATLFSSAFMLKNKVSL